MKDPLISAYKGFKLLKGAPIGGVLKGGALKRERALIGGLNNNIYNGKKVMQTWKKYFDTSL